MKIICLLLLQLGPSLAFNFPKGCEVRSKWEKDNQWSGGAIGAWIPHEGHSKILSIKIEVEGQRFPSAFDKLDIFKKKFKFTRKREGQRTITNITEISALKPGHWAIFAFTVDSRYSIKYLDSSLPGPSEDVTETFLEDVIATPTKFRIKGDYVTINCPRNTRVWNVNETPVVIPLDDQEGHSFVFLSNKTFEVSLILEERVFPLGWHNGTITMTPSLIEPLPPFQQHLVELLCHDDDKVICDIKTGINRDISEKNIQISSKLTSVTISSKNGEFFVLEGRPIIIGLHAAHSVFPVLSKEERLRVAAYWMTIAILLFVFGVAWIGLLYLEKFDATKTRRQGDMDTNVECRITEETTMINEH